MRYLIKKMPIIRSNKSHDNIEYVFVDKINNEADTTEDYKYLLKFCRKVSEKKFCLNQLKMIFLFL